MIPKWTIPARDDGKLRFENYPPNILDSLRRYLAPGLKTCSNHIESTSANLQQQKHDDFPQFLTCDMVCNEFARQNASMKKIYGEVLFQLQETSH